jgi:hypothetical protein
VNQLFAEASALGVASGGLHVDKALREYLTRVLEYRYVNEELKFFIRDGITNFEQHGKRIFVSSEQGISVKVGERKVTDYSVNISNGEMSITGYWRFTLVCAQLMSSHYSATTYRLSFRSVSTRWWTL